MRVLLVEDDRATAQSIDLMLKSDGFNVYVLREPHDEQIPA
jgi:two-component system cell cycle response regulator CtrA